MTHSTPVFDFRDPSKGLVDAETQVRAVDLDARVAEHARRYAGVPLNSDWIVGHIAAMTGQARTVSILARSEPMVAATPPSAASKEPSSADPKESGATTGSTPLPRSDRQDRVPPPPPPPPPQRHWLVRSAPDWGTVVIIVTMIGLMYWYNAAAWTFLVMVPALIAAVIHRHTYQLRIEELSKSVVAEARYVRRYFPDEYPSYLEEATIALNQRGAGRFVRLLPPR